MDPVQRNPRTTYVLVGVLVLLTLALVVFLFMNKKFTPTNTEITDRGEVSKIPVYDPIGASKKNTTVEEVNAFIAQFDAELANPNLSEPERKRLLVQKAQILTMPRTFDLMRENITEAYTIYKSVYESPTNSQREKLIKNVVIPATIHGLSSSCYPTFLGDYLPGEYSGLYQKFIDEGYAPKASVMLAYLDFSTKGLDEEYFNDNATVNYRAYMAASYLHSFGREGNTFDKEILKNLRRDVDMNGILKPVLFNSYIKGTVEPAMAHAYAFDIAYSYGFENLSDETNQAIDFRYEQAYPLIDAIENDSNTEAMDTLILTVHYLESLHRRYDPEEIDTEKVNALIDLFIENMSHSNETKDVFSGYLIEGKAQGGSWQKYRANFYDVAAKYPKLKKYLEDTAGIPF